MENKNQSQKKIGVGIASTVIVVVVAITAYSHMHTVAAPAIEQSSTAPVVPVAVTTPTPVVTTKSTYVYKDGTYSATGSYMSPGGEDQVAVTLTLANDIVTAASVTPTANDRTSERYQSKFLSGYQQYVIGKDISTLNLGAVSGSSLTPIGFNNAVMQIKAQAKA